MIVLIYLIVVTLLLELLWCAIIDQLQFIMDLSLHFSWRIHVNLNPGYKSHFFNITKKYNFEIVDAYIDKDCNSLLFFLNDS